MKQKYDNVLVLGIGGGACKIIHEIAQQTPGDWMKLAALDCDVKDLEFIDGVLQIPLGDEWTHGQGCGGDAVMGEHLAAHVLRDVRELLENVELTILVSCLGGGAGSGGIQLLHRLLREEECIGFSVVTTPLELEGSDRTMLAKQALESLRGRDDLVIAIENEAIFHELPAHASFTSALEHINRLIADSILGLATTVRGREGIPLDLATLYKLLCEKPSACSIASVRASGDDRATAVVDNVLAKPSLGGTAFLDRANVIVAALCGGPELALAEMDQTLKGLRKHLSASVRTMMSASPIPGLNDDELRLTVLAIHYERMRDQVARDQYDALNLADLTMKLSPNEEFLPVSTNDVSGLLGIFGNASPTIYRGENLDMPSFVRKGITLQQIVESLYDGHSE